MRSPADMDIVQIELTNRCHLNCSNCTRLIAHQVETREMDLETFERAVRSMHGWYKPGRVLGLIGGEPTLHRDFERLAYTFRDLWNDHPRKVIGRKPVADFNAFANERLFDRSSGRGLWTSLGPGFYRHYETIMDVFDHWNTNTHEAGGLHQAGLIDRKELCQARGISDEQWLHYRDNCWVQNQWSASITPKGAYFCEFAAQLDLLYNDGKRAWPIEPGWWKRTPDQFGEQLEICEMCSLCLPGPSSVDADEKDIVGENHRVRLQMVGSPAIRRGEFEAFDPEKHTQERLVETKDSYVAGRRVGVDHKSVLPKKVTAVVVCVGRAEYLKLTLAHNAKLVDEIIVVTDGERDDNDQATRWAVYEARKTAGAELARKIILVSSDRYRENGDVFNKGKMLNDGLKAVHSPDWVIFTDADVFLNPKLKEFLATHALNPGVLYGTLRQDLRPEGLDYFLESKNFDRGPTSGVDAEPNGYFQLFNVNAQALRPLRRPKVRDHVPSQMGPRQGFLSEEFCSAGGVDSWFMQQFPPDKRVVIPELAVVHIAHRHLGNSAWNGPNGPEPGTWRQCGMITADGWMELEQLPDGPVRLKLTDTLHGASVSLQAEHALPEDVLRVDDQGLVFQGKPIGHHHVHVAYRVPDAVKPDPEVPELALAFCEEEV